MALAHHDAAGRDQRRGREAELVGAEQRAHHHVAPGADAAVDLHGDAPAQPVDHQRLVGLGQADLPWATGVLDRGQRACAGAALKAGDGDVIGARLGNAGGDRADADFGHQLHRHVAGRIGVLQVEDQLRQVLDRIDVMVRRRRNQGDAGGRVAHLGDGLVDLVAGQLAAFAGLGALRHFDLHHVRVDEILGGDAEAAGGHLLDGRAHGITIRQRLEAFGLLATFAGVRLAADAVHGDGERGVRLARDRTERHGAGGEAPHDGLGRLHLFDRYRLAAVFLRRLDAEQAANGHQPFVLLVHDSSEGAVVFLRIAAHRVLQAGDGLGGPDMVLAAHAHRIVAADVEHRCVDRRIAEGVAVAAHRLFGDLGQPHAFDAGMGAGEILVDEVLAQADRVENLRAAIGLIGGDAHLRHHLEQAFVDRLDVALDDFLLVELLRQIVLHGDQRLEGEIGVDRFRAVAGQAGEMMHLARLAGFHHQADRGAQAAADEMMMHGRAG